MPSDVMVWDLETVPDIGGFARANNLIGQITGRNPNRDG